MTLTLPGWSGKNTFLSVVDSFIPKHTTKRLPTPPYLTRDLLHAIKRKESLRRKAKKKDTPDLWERFRIRSVSVY